MSESSSDSSGTASAAASESSLAAETDILVAESSTDVLPVGAEEQGVALLGEPGNEDSAVLESAEGTLDLADVLPGGAIDASLGVFLTFDTVGGDTVVSVEMIEKHPGASVQFVTLEGVTGVTLQQLLNNNEIYG
jgi:hypothetical protein